MKPTNWEIKGGKYAKALVISWVITNFDWRDI